MKITPIEEVMAGFPLCRDLPPAVVDELRGCARFRVYRPGQTLLTEGGAVDEIFMIRSGSVAIEVDPPGRGPVVIETLGAGEVVGVSWLLPPYRSLFDARARAETHTVVLDAVCLRGHCDEDHELGYQLMHQFAGAIRDRLQATRLQLLDVYGNAR